MEVTDKDREVSRNCRNAWDRNVDCAAEIVAAHREQAIIPLARALTAMVALAEKMGMDVWDTSALSEEGLALIEAKRVLDECK